MVSAGSLCHSSRLKFFPDGSIELLVCSESVFHADGWELASWDVKKKRRSSGSSDLSRSRRRASASVRDLALCNSFTWFVTLTLDSTKIDRYDIKAITKKLNTWLDNAVRRKGLKYILVPEYHKDGAIHFHGFFNDISGFTPSGTYSGGLAGPRPRRPASDALLSSWLSSGAHEVFNFEPWGFGFTSAIRLYGEYEKAISYVCKYISKSEEKIGGRWFFSGGSLSRPEISFSDFNLSEVLSLDSAFAFSVAGRSYALWRGSPEILSTLGCFYE